MSLSERLLSYKTVCKVTSHTKITNNLLSFYHYGRNLPFQVVPINTIKKISIMYDIDNHNIYTLFDLHSDTYANIRWQYVFDVYQTTVSTKEDTEKEIQKMLDELSIHPLKDVAHPLS